MRMTYHADLGFRTLVYLASAAPEGATIPQIAEAYDVSENHLRKVSLHLTKLGLVDSSRGKGGGLKLAKDPSKISIGWAMRRLEPDFAIVECMGVEPQRCIITGNCGLQSILMEALKTWFMVLDSYTLADAIKGSKRLNHLLQIPA
jgi:Rrf2 family nitric oxide-sensitive transcriptional repressor